MQITQSENQWVVTYETPAEEAILQLVIPLLKKVAPDIIRWLNNIAHNLNKKV